MPIYRVELKRSGHERRYIEESVAINVEAKSEDEARRAVQELIDNGETTDYQWVEDGSDTADYEVDEEFIASSTLATDNLESADIVASEVLEEDSEEPSG